MPSLTVEPIRIATPIGDEPGLLVLIEHRLTAVLTRLDGSGNGQARGHWYLEAAFGRCALRPPEPHHRLSDALRWIADNMDVGASITDAELTEIERRFNADPPCPQDGEGDQPQAGGGAKLRGNP